MINGLLGPAFTVAMLGAIESLMSAVGSDRISNDRQNPKLPDWAVLDVDAPATSQRPAGVVTAGFFDERWQLPGESR